MKKLLVLIVMLSFPLMTCAKVPAQKTGDLPQGVFKKSWNGNIVQYDNNGKKTHTYKMKNGKIVRVK